MSPLQMPSQRPKTLLIISQVFVPDPASVGQHMADVAFEMARRGHRVLVYASARGYENPTVKYPARDMINGAEIRRLGLASFGKKSFLLRVRVSGFDPSNVLTVQLPDLPEDRLAAILERVRTLPARADPQLYTYWTFLSATDTNGVLAGLRLDSTSDLTPVEIAWLAVDLVR